MFVLTFEVFFDFCGIFQVLWCFSWLLGYFLTFIIGIFWLLWYLMTLVVFFLNVVVFFYICGIFWFLWYVLWCFLWLGIFFDFLNMQWLLWYFSNFVMLFFYWYFSHFVVLFLTFVGFFDFCGVFNFFRKSKKANCTTLTFFYFDSVFWQLTFLDFFYTNSRKILQINMGKLYFDQYEKRAPFL